MKLLGRQIENTTAGGFVASVAGFLTAGTIVFAWLDSQGVALTPGRKFWLAMIILGLAAVNATAKFWIGLHAKDRKQKDNQ